MKNLVLLLILFLIVACNQSQESKSNAQVINAEASPVSKRIIKIEQAVPTITHIELDRGRVSHGDLLAFHASIITDAGITGKLSGYLLTVFLPEENHEPHQERMAQMVFDLGEGNTIVVGGKAVYPHEVQSEMQIDEPQLRPVIGGTGTYIGARGQISTQRNSDGTYEHLIELIE